MAVRSMMCCRAHKERRRKRPGRGRAHVSSLCSPTQNTSAQCVGWSLRSGLAGGSESRHFASTLGSRSCPLTAGGGLRDDTAHLLPSASAVSATSSPRQPLPESRQGPSTSADMARGSAEKRSQCPCSFVLRAVLTQPLTGRNQKSVLKAEVQTCVPQPMAPCCKPGSLALVCQAVEGTA